MWFATSTVNPYHILVFALIASSNSVHGDEQKGAPLRNSRRPNNWMTGKGSKSQTETASCEELAGRLGEVGVDFTAS